MKRIGMTNLVAALATAALLAAVAGCGSDSSGEDSSPSVSIASPTSPIPTTTAATTTTTGGSKVKTTKTTSTTTGGGGSAPCSVPDAFQDFKFDGLDCSAALTVAKAWDANGKTCNTVDNPDSPIGPQRTCTVNGYSCTAKRDVHSDNRFVTCTLGGQSVRFT
ncbi:MAG TPA: hypothetical protein VH501_08975, partial [Solirubrobacterales bacterium]